MRTCYIHRGPSVTVARNSSGHVHSRLRIPTVQNQRQKCYTFYNFLRLCKVLDVSPLCHKVTYEPGTVAEGQGRFTQHLNCGGYHLYCERGRRKDLQNTLYIYTQLDGLNMYQINV